MAAALRLKFDPNQEYQVEAVQSVLRVLEGLPRHEVEFGLADEIVPNLPAHESLDEHWLFDNVLAVQ